MAEVSLYEQDLLRAASQDLPWQLLDGKNVLVTGATGLIGGAVADVLMAAPTSCRVFASGRNQQRAEKRFARYAQSDRFRFLPMDLTQPLEGDTDFHFVIDAAGGAAPRLYKEDPVGVMRSNLNGVDHLFQYGVRHALQRFLYVSSGEV